jgi:tetratricopeptide (TPR) repeat protein
MTNTHKDPLFILVKSLSKSEKRQFKLYVGRLGVNTDSKFISLFNLLDKHQSYNEKAILESGIVKKSQLSNLKAHLYKQILVSLRLNPVNQNVRIQLREQLDFATILYHKGLYRQSLKILDKAKQLAIDNQEKSIAFEIVELEKIIETQYITRSIPDRAEELAQQSIQLSEDNIVTSQLSNLSLQLYGMMLKFGYVRSDEELKRVKRFFDSNLPNIEYESLGFREKLWYLKAHLWYSFLMQDFLSSYKYSSRLVNLFYANPEMITLNPVFFLKGNNYLLEAQFFVKYRSQFRETLEKMEEVIKQKDFPQNDNVASLSFLYLSANRLNLHFLEGTFKTALYLVDGINLGIKKHKDRLDQHHIMILYYKIASLYFGVGDYKNAIEYLKKIIQNKQLKMREDLMCFARLLSLVAHYEAGMDYHLEVQLKSTYKFLLKMNDLQQVQKEIIKFLKSLGSVYPNDINKAFKKLHTELKKYENHPYEKRAFLYLDIISWLESHLEQKPIDIVIKEKANARSR